MLEKLKAKIFKTQIQEQTTTPPDTMLNEKVWWQSSEMYNLLGGIDTYNPDELVQRKGNKIYRKMLRDPQVKAAYDLRVNIIISRGWRFDIINDDQAEIAEFFERMITDHFVGTWIQAMRSILLCKAHGFSVTEKVFDSVDMDGKPRWVIRALKPKPFYTFEFDTDAFGNIKRVLQNIDGASKPIKVEKLVLMVNHPEFDPVWGESDLRAVYRPYWEKDVTLKFKNMYIERLAGGFVVANATADAPNLSPTEKTNFENVLSRINQMTAIRAPQGYEIDVKHGPSTTAFEDSVSFSDGQILRGLLIPNLMGFADMKFGSRALGDTQLDAFMMTVQEEGEYLADILNEQVFAQIAWWNFGRKDFPRFKLDGYTTTQKRKIAETWNTAVKDGVVVNTLKDENRTRELLLYPKVDEEERDEEKAANEPVEPIVKPVVPPIEPVKPVVPKEPIKPEVEPKKPDTQAPEKTVTKKEIFADEPDIIKEISFSSRINFADIENKLNQNEAQFVKGMAVVTNGMADTLIGQLETIWKGLPEDKTKIKADTLVEKVSMPSKLKSEFKQTVIANLKKNYELGRKEASTLLKKSLKKDANLSERLDFKLKFIDSWKVCCTDPNWTVKHFVDGLLLESAESFFESAAFQNTADITEAMLEGVRQALEEGIDSEASIEELIADFREAIPTLIGSVSKDGTISPKAAKARLETIARTSISNIYNQAQLALYNDPALGDFVQGMEYSAELDRRTTVTCQSLHGKKYRKNDPVWGSITPPNHFNCRSLLIPITMTDGEVSYSGKKE